MRLKQLEIAKKNDIKPSEALLKSVEMPLLPRYLNWVKEAFEILSTERQIGFGALGPIPWTALVRYCEVNGYYHEDYVYLKSMVYRLDNEYLKIVNAPKEEVKPNVDKHQKSGASNKWS